MKKLIIFLSGLLLLLVMFAALFLAGAIYDSGQKSTIETYFFQPDEASKQRPGAPVSPFDLGNITMRDKLIDRFMTEYFYVIPDTNDLINRTSGQKSLLYQLASLDVYTNWIQNVVPMLQKMAEEKKLQTVTVRNVYRAPGQEDYWIVDYELITWERPNDFSVAPIVTPGQVYLKILYEANDGLRKYINNKPILHALESNMDPAAAFRFEITDISSYDDTAQVAQ